MMESIEKLRERVLKYAPNIRREVCMALDEIEAEIAEKYIDSNGNYEPSNCRWVDMKTQNANRRPFKHGNRYTKAKGESRAIHN